MRAAAPITTVPSTAQHCAAPTDPSAMGGPPHLMRPCRRGSWDTVRDRRSSTPRRKRACCLQRERESATTVHCGSHQPVLRGEQVTHHHSLPAFSLLKLAPALAVDWACGLCSFPMQAMPNLRPSCPALPLLIAVIIQFDGHSSLSLLKQTTVVNTDSTITA
jgi:hypothetical protein